MGAVVLCLLLLVAMPDPRQSATSDHIPPKIGDGVESTASPLTTSTHSTSVQGLMSAISDRNIRLTIPVFLVGIFRYAMLNILIQYASVRFGLKISSGAIFYTETAFVNIFLFLFLIPHITSYVRLRFNVQPSVIDLFLVRTSVSLMCVGCLAIGLAQSNSLLPCTTSSANLANLKGVFVFAAGFGSRVSALSLVSYWISDDAKATLYAAIVVLESLGHAVGDPSIQQIFAASLQLPPFWMAMPFFVGAVSCCLMFGSIC